jgi:hypothetical protein
MKNFRELATVPSHGTGDPEELLVPLAFPDCFANYSL